MRYVKNKREHLFACAECTGRYTGMCRACLFASGWVRACDWHIPNVPTQTYRHLRDKMAVVAVSLATIPDSYTFCCKYINTSNDI